MKKYIKVLTVATVLLMASDMGVQAQKWQLHWQSISEGEQVKFFDANTGYMSSSQYGPMQMQPGARLIKTTNGGLDWHHHTFDSSRVISAFDFLTPDYGIVCLDYGMIRKTTNGGISWIYTTLPDADYFHEIKIISEQLVYAISFTKFYASTNGGGSWTAASAPTGVFYDNFEFVNATLGYIRSGNKIRKTTNGGQNWQLMADIGSFPSSATQNFHFANANLGFAVADSGRVMRTTNGGTSWSRQSVGSQFRLKDIAFSDADNGCLIGQNSWDWGVIFRTTNGGLSWQQQAELPRTFTHLAVLNASVAYVCGNFATVVRTTNQGQNWDILSDIKDGFKDIHFPGSRTGYMISAIENFGSFLNKTTNGGQMWLAGRVGEFDEPKLKAVWFTDSLTGYLAGEEGKIIKTTDGGKVWAVQNSGLSTTIERLCFTGPATGFALGGSQTATLMLRTTNASQSWAAQSLPVSDRPLRDIWFVNPSAGFMAGGAGLLLKTTNGGGSWFQLVSNTTANLNSVWFKDINNGFVAAENGTVLRTTDAGNSWTAKLIHQGGTLNDVKCMANLCYAVGKKPLGDIYYDPLLYRSTDMGISWTEGPGTGLPYSAQWAYIRLYVRSATQAYRLTDSPRMLEHNAIGTSVLRPKYHKNNLTFDVYPNPSPTGNFSLRHKYQGKISMSIMGVQGQLIEKKELNKSELQIKLSPGLYFIRLENEQNSSVEKLVVY